MSLILITGGMRAGKSTYAEVLAKEIAGAKVCYVATAEAKDSEMTERIAAHRRNRPEAWLTIEAPRRVAAIVRENGWPVLPMRAVLIDCVTMLVNNIQQAHLGSADERPVWIDLETEIAGLLELAAAGTPDAIIVTNEVGLGIVPMTELSRAYIDLLGWANKKLAAAADEVYLVVAGIPLAIKRRRPQER